jgi:hypothetical protein
MLKGDLGCLPLLWLETRQEREGERRQQYHGTRMKSTGDTIFRDTETRKQKTLRT